MEALGRHFLVELFGCDKVAISDVAKVEDVLNEAATRSNATILKSEFHQFEPYGISGMVIIAESHLSIHTWPEYGYAAADVFTCGEELEPEKAIDYMIAHFKANNSTAVEIKRGMLKLPEGKLRHKNTEVLSV